MSDAPMTEQDPCRFAPLREHKPSECPLCNPTGWMAEPYCPGGNPSEPQCLCDAPDYGINEVWCEVHPNPGQPSNPPASDIQTEDEVRYWASREGDWETGQRAVEAHRAKVAEQRLSPGERA